MDLGGGYFGCFWVWISGVFGEGGYGWVHWMEISGWETGCPYPAIGYILRLCSDFFVVSNSLFDTRVGTLLGGVFCREQLVLM